MITTSTSSLKIPDMGFFLRNADMGIWDKCKPPDMDMVLTANIFLLLFVMTMQVKRDGVRLQYYLNVDS